MAGRFSFYRVIIISLIVGLTLCVHFTITQASTLIQEETPYNPPGPTDAIPTDSYPFPSNETPSPTIPITPPSTPTPSHPSSTALSTAGTPATSSQITQPVPTSVHRYATEMAEMSLARVIPEVTEEIPARTRILESPQAEESSPHLTENLFDKSKFGLGLFISLALTLGAFVIIRFLQSSEFQIKK